MTYTIVGLGNPGQEYANTRHNTGFIIVDDLWKFFDKEGEVNNWKEDMKLNALVAKAKLGKASFVLVKPQTFMNLSGQSVKPLINSVKKAESLVVIHDDLDLAIGRAKLSFNKSAGGHRGVESIIKAVKTEEFIRIRVGISPATPTGKLKKPTGEEVVGDFIVAKFKEKEFDEIKKVSKEVKEAVSVLAEHGLNRTMSEFNGKF
jgi:PTH1 family peptidyl-tRNA hydrolase